MYHWIAKNLLPLIDVLCASGAVLCPVTAYTHELGPQLDCKSSAHAFIAALEDDQYIDPKPMRVEANSVNAFRPTRGSDLTAFGFRVYAVLGYARDDELFKQGRGEAIEGSVYGAVVFGSTDSVEGHIHEAGSDAVVHEVLPLALTAIICNER